MWTQRYATPLALVAGGLVACAPAGAATASFRAAAPRVAPAHAYVDGTPVAIAFSVRAREATDLQVDVVRPAKNVVVRRFVVRHAASNRRVRLRWNALTPSGRPAPTATTP